MSRMHSHNAPVSPPHSSASTPNTQRPSTNTSTAPPPSTSSIRRPHRAATNFWNALLYHHPPHQHQHLNHHLRRHLSFHHCAVSFHQTHTFENREKERLSVNTYRGSNKESCPASEKHSRIILEASGTDDTGEHTAYAATRIISISCCHRCALRRAPYVLRRGVRHSSKYRISAA